MKLKGKALHVPCVSLGRFMTEEFDQHGDRTALVDPITGRILTYSEVSDTVRRLARGLASIGFKKGDVLCIFSHNVLEYPIVFYAVVSLGGILQTADPTYNSSELKHGIDLCKSKFLVTVPTLLPTVRHAQINVPIIIIGEAHGCLSFSSLIKGSISSEPVSDNHIDPREDVAAILLSSGTTGKPKAVQLSHYAIVANVLQMLASGNLSEEEDTYVTFLPLFHLFGLIPITSVGLYSGAVNVLVPRFQTHVFLRYIEIYKPTVLHLVPPVMVVLSELPSIHHHNLSSVRRIISGSAPLSKDIEGKIIRLFNLNHISQAYGMTECQATHIIRDKQYKFGSVGVLLPGTECKIVDIQTKETLPADVDGEIYVRGPSVMKGYLANPKATKETFENGWLRTGDVGHVDKDGFLYIVDRIKELIKYKGFQVAPAELEDILLSHPDVADAGVIGIPDVYAGELPKAFVVRKAGSTVSEREIQEYVEGKVSGTKRLRGGVTFLSEIPKSASGKILRRVLRDMEKNTRSKL